MNTLLLIFLDILQPYNYQVILKTIICYNENMIVVSEKRISDDLFLTIQRIEEENNLGFLATLANIRNVLIGNRKNPYFSLYKKYENLFGSYDEINESDIKKTLEKLIKEKTVFWYRRDGQTIYSSKPIEKKETGKELNALAFYDNCSREEKELVDRVTSFFDPIVPAFEWLDYEKYRGFRPKEDKFSNRRFWFWITRDENDVIELRYRKNPENHASVSRWQFVKHDLEYVLDKIRDYLEKFGFTLKLTKKDKNKEIDAGNKGAFYNSLSSDEKGYVDAVISGVSRPDVELDINYYPTSVYLISKKEVDNRKPTLLYITRKNNRDLVLKYRKDIKADYFEEIVLSKSGVAHYLKTFESNKFKNDSANNKTLLNGEHNLIRTLVVRKEIITMMMSKAYKRLYGLKDSAAKALVDAIPINMITKYLPGGFKKEFYTRKRAEDDYNSYKIDIFVNEIRKYENIYNVKIIDDIKIFRASLGDLLKRGENIGFVQGLCSNFSLVPEDSLKAVSEYFDQFEMTFERIQSHIF